jgi:formate dehydrogenase alpha subunit
MHKILTTCCFCACGCGLYLHVDNQDIVGVTPSKRHPISRGNLCIRGWNCIEFIRDIDRLREPLVKKNGKLVKATWDEALSLTARKFLEIRDRHGEEALGVLSSAKCTNEENYLLMKFARAVLRTNNIDHCARLCHSPTVFGLTHAFGSGAMTNSIRELSNAEVIMVIGSNTTEQHPQIARFIFDALEKGAKLIVIDPRRIQLSKSAHIYLRPHPGTDVICLNGMMKIILRENLIDDSFIEMRTENFENFKVFLEEFDLRQVETISGISLPDLERAARVYASAKRALIIYSMGITQHVSGTDNVQSIANLAMLTGHVEQEFTGVAPLRGQSNVQGACDMGALPGVLCGYQGIGDESVMSKFRRAWGVDLPSVAGLTAVEMAHDPEGRKIKGMYIMGENPMLSHPEIKHVRRILEGMEFLAVSDIFLTETAELADVIFPAASFVEKDGTVTNMERRIQRIRKSIPPLASSKPDWEIISELSNRMYYPMDYESPAEIMEEIAMLTPIYAGVNYDRLEKGWGLQWPCWDGNHPGTPFLHKGSFARGKGLFTCVDYHPSSEMPDENYPFILTTGRVYSQWHTGTISRRISVLDRECPQAFAEINPNDAKALGLNKGCKVKVTSRRGEIVVKAQLTDSVPENVVFVPFHFKEAPANSLTNAALDPKAKTPEFKVCAVRLEKVE